MVIGIHRTEAIGDIIMLSGVIKHFKSKGYRVLFSSKYKNINWSNFLEVDYYTDDKGLVQQASDEFYDFDMCYEAMPSVPAWEAYSLMVGIPVAKPDKKEFVSIELSDVKDSIVIHAGVSNDARTLPRKVWDEVVKGLGGYKVICIGKGVDYQLDVPCYFKESLMGIRDIIDNARLFVGMDSGLMHVAQCTNTTVVGIFNIARPSNRLWRENCHAIVPDCDCQFCLERAVTNYVKCPELKCIDNLYSDKILNKIKGVL